MDISSNYIIAKYTTSSSGQEPTGNKNTRCPKATGHPAWRCFPASQIQLHFHQITQLHRSYLSSCPEKSTAQSPSDVLLSVVMATKVRNYNLNLKKVKQLCCCGEEEHSSEKGISESYLKIPFVFGMFPVLRDLCLSEKLLSFCQPLIKYLHVIMKPSPLFNSSVKLPREKKYESRERNGFCKTHTQKTETIYNKKRRQQ